MEINFDWSIFMYRQRYKIFIAVIFFIIFLLILKLFALEQYLTFGHLKLQQNVLRDYYINSPISTSLIYIAIYVVVVAFSFPGASVLTLAGGAIFGLYLGTFLVSISSTIGATLVFLGTRFLFKEFVKSRFQNQLQKLEEGFQKEGVFYLLTLRLIPIFPFFLINILMGLTRVTLAQYFYLSMVGMLPATIVYVNAGTQLSKIHSLKDVASPSILFSLFLLAFVPIILKYIIGSYKKNKFLKIYKKPLKYDYNLIVIGAGSAGLVSSYIASKVKAKVLLIEKNRMGGDCLNTGCVPSKAFIKASKVASLLKNSQEYGILKNDMAIDFKKIMERVQLIIKKIEPHDSIQRYQSLGVECLLGNAEVKSPFEVEVQGKIYTTKNIIIATGAGPFIPDIIGLEKVDYLTSDNVWALRELPKKLVVIGGGPIGCELSQSFSRLGSKVILIESSSSLLNKEDDDVSKLMMDKFSQEGIEVFVNHKVMRIDVENNCLICVSNGEEEKEISISFEKILVALGRKAHVSGFGLENLKVEISDHGTIVADEFMRTTNYPNIFVCGDVAGPFQLTHAAAHQAWYAVVNALFGSLKKFKVDYRIIPWCTFVDPEVARVGINEKDAKALGVQYQVSYFPLKELDRAITESEENGFVKVLTKPRTDKILGVTIVGSHAGEIIGEYVQAMKYGLGMNKILGTIHIYPTFAEANKYAAGIWKLQNTPQWIFRYAEKFHRWMRG